MIFIPYLTKFDGQEEYIMSNKNKAVYFPILLNIKEHPCLIIGGGNVASRKVASLLNFNAKVTVLAPQLCAALQKLQKKGSIKVIKKVYNVKYLENFDVVFCATNNKLTNESVRKDCTKKKILLNVADIPELCDFILPAIVKRGNLTIAVSSQGIAPFYTKNIKNKLDHTYPTYYENIIELAGEFRSLVLNSKKYTSSKIREEAFTKFFMLNWKEIINKQGMNKARKYFASILNDL